MYIVTVIRNIWFKRYSNFNQNFTRKSKSKLAHARPIQHELYAHDPF